MTAEEEREKGVLRGRGGGLGRNVLALGLTSFFNDLSSEMAYPLLPLFLTEVLGAGALFLGLVEGLADFIASFLQIFSGWFSDRLKRRKGLALGGYTLSGAARACLAVVTAPWQALAAWFFNRVGKGVRTAPRDALIADSCAPAERGRSFGYHRAMDHLGALSGAAAASILLAASGGGYRMVFALAVFPLTLALVALGMGVKERSAPSKRGSALGTCAAPASSEAPLRLNLRPFDLRFRLFLAAVFLFTLGNSSDVFLLLRARQAGGMEAAMIPALWGILHVVKSIANLGGGEFSDRLGRKKVIVAGWTVYALSYLGFAFADRAAWFWLLFVFYGFYFMYESAGKAMVADLVPVELRGTAFGLYNFVVSLTLLPASLIMGLLWKVDGLNYAFLFGASTAGGAIVFLLMGSLVMRGSA